MRKGPLIASLFCQVLILALLSYGLNLGCLLQPDACVEESACCVSCNLPAHIDAKPDQAVHIKLSPLLLSTETLTLTAVTLHLGEVEPSFEVELPPRTLLAHPTDPVRGPPLTV
jgi:hypothetical protein